MCWKYYCSSIVNNSYSQYQSILETDCFLSTLLLISFSYFFQFHTRFHSSLLRKKEQTDSISPKSTSHFLYAPFSSNHFLHIKILCTTHDFDHFVFTLEFTLPNIHCFILNPHSVVPPRFSLTIRLFRCHLVFHFDPMLRTIQRSRLLIQSVRAITQRISNGRKNHFLMF